MRDVYLRHANHYLQQLHKLTRDYQLGGNAIMPALAAFEQEWQQIRSAQMWTATNASRDPAIANLCNSFANIGSILLYLRRTPVDQIEWIEAGLTAARQLGDLLSEGVHLCHQGDAYQVMSDFQRAKECYVQAIKVAQIARNSPIQVAALSGLDRCSQRLGQLSDAESYRKQAEMLNSSTDVQAQLSRIQIGELILQRKYREAINPLQIMLASSRQTGNLRDEVEHLTNLGIVNMGLEDYAEAVKLLERALPLARQLGSKETESLILGNLANSHYFLGHYQLAIDYFHPALAAASVLNSRDLEAGHLFNLGAAFMQLKQYEDAYKAFEQAVILYEKLGIDDKALAARKQMEIIDTQPAWFLSMLRGFTQTVHRTHLNNVLIDLKKHIDKN